MQSNQPYNRAPFDLAQLEALAPGWAGRVHFVPSIGSTNEAARQSLRQNLPHTPALWLTDQQLAGRGRLGRSWQAPAYSSLLFTLAFRLELPLNQAFLYGAALSLAIQEAVQILANLKLDLKWPNDLLRDGRKVAGILAEVENGVGVAHNQTWLALGCGLNVNVSETEFAAAALETKATSLFASDQNLTSREELLAAILNHWEVYQGRLHTQPAAVRYEWNSRLITVGKWVEIWLNNRVEAAGTAIGIDDDGALIISQASGVQRSFAAGDVSVRLPDGRYSA